MVQLDSAVEPRNILDCCETANKCFTAQKRFGISFVRKERSNAGSKVVHIKEINAKATDEYSKLTPSQKQR